MGTPRARRIAGRMSVMMERKKEERRIAALWSKMKATMMRRRRRRIAMVAAAAAAIAPKEKMNKALKQQLPRTLRPHNPRGLKHMIYKYARVERCGKASEMVTKSGEETTDGSLPFHIMAEHILPRLPVKSLARFRSVCKQWCYLTYNPCFAKGQLERTPETESPAFISSFAGNLNKFHVYNFIKLNNGGEAIKERTFTFKFGVALSHTLSNSINGLVCAVYEEGSASERSCILFNPTTQEVLPLPKISNAEYLYNMTMDPPVLGFDGSAGEYKLVQPHNISHLMSKPVHSRDPQPLRSCAFKVLTVGTQEWRYVGETPCWVCTEEVVYLNGTLHWLTVKYNPGSQVEVILAFDVKDERFRFISVPKIIPDCSYRTYLSLQKLEGHICLVKNPMKPPRNQVKPPPSLKIWKLDDYPNHGWKLEYDVDMSRLKHPYDGHTHVLDIACGKVLVRRHEDLYSYDICRRTWHKLIELRNGSRLHVLTESLISPSNLPVL